MKEVEIQMKKLNAGVLFIFVLGLFAMSLPAAPAAAEKQGDDDEAVSETKKSEGKSKKKAHKEKSKSATGKIKSINAKSGTLTIVKKVKGEPKEFVIAVNDHTKFKNIKGLADLKEGDKVQAKFAEKDGKKFAHSVELKTNEGKKPAKKKAKKKKEKEEEDDEE